MLRRVLWFLFCLLMTAVHGLDDCLPSREVYVNLSLGVAEDVPVDFTSGKTIEYGSCSRSWGSSLLVAAERLQPTTAQ